MLNAPDHPNIAFRVNLTGACDFIPFRNIFRYKTVINLKRKHQPGGGAADVPSLNRHLFAFVFRLNAVNLCRNDAQSGSLPLGTCRSSGVLAWQNRQSDVARPDDVSPLIAYGRRIPGFFLFANDALNSSAVVMGLSSTLTI